MSIQALPQSQERINKVFNIFAHHRRRYALRVLHQHEKPIALADLADEIAVRENETPLADIPPDEVKQIYMSLYHRHVPKLSDAGFVRYDQERDIVTLSERAERIEQYQEFLTIE